MKTFLAALVLSLPSFCSAAVPEPASMAIAAPAQLSKTFEDGAYRVTLQVQGTNLIARVEGRGADGTYAELRDLTAHEMVTGELFLLGGKDGALKHFKSYMEGLEYESGGVGPWMTFKLGEKPAGSYRAWVEFERGGRVHQFSFALGF